MRLLSVLSTGWTPDLRGYLALAAVFFIGGFVPILRTPLVLASGVVFGLTAIPVIVVSSTAGSVGSFLLGRHLLQARVRRLLARRRLSGAVMRAVDLEGWRVVALMRLWGPLPTTVQNYAFAMSRIGLVSFALATLVFSVPQTVFYSYLGSLGQSALRGEFPGYVSIVTAAAACLCAVTVVVLVGHRVRTVLRKAGGDPVLDQSALTPPAA